MSDRRSAAIRYHAAIGRARIMTGRRNLGDGPTWGELALEGQWERELWPPLGELYRQPIVANLPAMMEMSEADISRSVLEFYQEHPATLTALLIILQRYARRGFDLGGQMGLSLLGLDGQFDLTDADIIAQIMAYVERLVSTSRRAQLSLPATTADEIARAVARHRDEGVELADLMPLLSAWILGRTVIRSAMIAATESVRMSRWGMMSVFAGNGIRGVVHECEADVEERCTSGACPPLCGTEYELGGVLNPMSGISRAGWIPLHPRCILPGNEVVIPGRLSAATQSFYDGGAVEITVRSGRVLTVTENHPILTPDGYVAAKLLREGGYVISALDSDRIATAINPDNDHTPTAIEEVFRAFKESPFVTTARMPVAAKDFHGDGRAIYGDVDVVYVDRLLEGGGYVASGQKVGQMALGGHDMGLVSLLSLGLPEPFLVGDGSAAHGFVGGSDLGGFFVGRHLRPFEGFGLGTAAGLNAGGQQTAAYWTACDSEAVGDGLFGFAGQVAPDNGINIEGEAVHAPVLEGTGFAHESDNDIARHALLAREFTNRFAGLVAADEIVGIREFVFSGHVYDLQCDEYELYITSGVITSNCRCYYSPLRDGWVKPALIWTGFAVGLLD